MEVSQFTLNPLDRQLWLCEFFTTFNQDPKCAAVVLSGDPLFLWFAKGMKELQGEAEDFQTGIYTPLILSPASQPEWHDMNVVRKAAANSHHSCSSPHTCKGNVWIPGLLLDALCHQKRVFSE